MIFFYSAIEFGNKDSVGLFGRVLFRFLAPTRRSLITKTIVHEYVYYRDRDMDINEELDGYKIILDTDISNIILELPLPY